MNYDTPSKNPRHTAMQIHRHKFEFRGEKLTRPEAQRNNSRKNAKREERGTVDKNYCMYEGNS